MTNGSSDSVSRAIDLAQRIVKAQGNIFIKEFLRQKKRDNSAIRIGATKEEILANLIAAIEQGAILGSDLDAWLSDVEGWGKQYEVRCQRRHRGVRRSARERCVEECSRCASCASSAR